MGASQSSTASGSVLDFYGRDGRLYAKTPGGEEKEFFIKGANWFGSEAYNGPPGGLDHHSTAHYMSFLARHDFNAIRLLFNHACVLKNDIVESPTEEPLLFQVRCALQSRRHPKPGAPPDACACAPLARSLARSPLARALTRDPSPLPRAQTSRCFSCSRARRPSTASS